MSAPEPVVREDELHAYVDGQLPSARLPAMMRHLDANPADAARVARYIEQRQALRAAFAAEETEPLPPELDLSRLMEQRLRRRSVSWQIAASVVVALGIGAAGGWILRTPSPPPRVAAAMSVLEQQALASHAVYAVEKRHPVEVGAADEDHLKHWLSNRLDRPVTPPTLSSVGFHLIGGRLLATERGGAAALFMYENDQGTRLSLLMRPMAPDLRASQVEMTDGKVNGCAWISRGMGYAVLVAAPDQELDKIYEQIRTELATSS